MGRHARQGRHVPAFVQALIDAIPPRGAEAMFAPTTPISRPGPRVIDLRDLDLRQTAVSTGAGATRGHTSGAGA